MSLTIPSSVFELESGGDGVNDLNDDAPLLDPSGEGRSAILAICGENGE